MIYVMSDVHGRMARYKDIMRQIKLKKEDHLYVLGDVIDRGPHGLRILMDLIRRPNVTVLLGNHERMMLDTILNKDSDSQYLWYINDGGVTYQRFKFFTAVHKLHLIEEIKKMPVNVEVRCNGKDYLLVHGGPLDNSKDDPIADSVWRRLDSDTPVPAGKIVVFGHTPTSHYQRNRPLSIFFGEDKIGIDCGCTYPSYMKGRLGCLRLDDMKEFYSAATDVS